MPVELLARIGALVAVYLGIRGALVVFDRILAPNRSWKQQKGTWAIITGASDGIGRAFAFSCAKRGLNVAIIARRTERLREVAQEIERKYQTQVAVVPADLAAGRKELSKFAAELEGLFASRVVSLLINNLGGAPWVLDRGGKLLWAETPFEEVVNTRRLNVDHVMQLTRIFLPKMLERGGGGVINVSSTSALGSPFLANYAGDKAKIDSFTRAVGGEVRSHGVVMQSIHIVEVSTPCVGNPPTSFFVRSADELSEATLNSFGRGGYVRTPLWQHALLEWLLCLLPEVMRVGILGHAVKEGLKVKAAKRRLAQCAQSNADVPNFGRGEI